jgi:hypothetical protein
VAPAQTLKAARTTTRPGFAAITLDYPPAYSNEAVGDPPGDSTADLTARPAHATSGKATFLVNGQKKSVNAGPDGVFEVPATPGARIELKPGATQDTYGNSNGNDLTFAA